MEISRTKTTNPQPNKQTKQTKPWLTFALNCLRRGRFLFILCLLSPLLRHFLLDGLLLPLLGWGPFGRRSFAAHCRSFASLHTRLNWSTEWEILETVFSITGFYFWCTGSKALDTNKERRPSLLLWNISWAPLRMEEDPAATAIIHAGKTLLFWAGGAATHWTGFPSSGETESFYKKNSQKTEWAALCTNDVGGGTKKFSVFYQMFWWHLSYSSIFFLSSCQYLIFFPLSHDLLSASKLNLKNKHNWVKSVIYDFTMFWRVVLRIRFWKYTPPKYFTSLYP